MVKRFEDEVDDFIEAYAKHMYVVFEKQFPEIVEIMKIPTSPEYVNARIKLFETWYRDFCKQEGLSPEPMPNFVKIPPSKITPE